MPDLHAEPCVWVDVGQGEEVRGPHEEMAMEGVQGHPSRTPSQDLPYVTVIE